MQFANADKIESIFIEKSKNDAVENAFIIQFFHSLHTLYIHFYVV